MIQPIRGQLYSLKQIEEELELMDSPCLEFMCLETGKKEVIQTAHLKDGELITPEGFAETRWQYRFTTYEWIPVFLYIPESGRNINEFVDIDVYKEEAWVTPKGFPREDSPRWWDEVGTKKYWPELAEMQERMK